MRCAEIRHLHAIVFPQHHKVPTVALFLLMTLGPALLFLRMAEGGTPALLRPALMIGRVPLFYFILHFAFIHVLALVVCWVTFGSPHWMVESADLGKYPFPAVNARATLMSLRYSR